MLNPESAQAAAESAPVFAALGDTTRLELVKRLSFRRNHSITSLSDGLALSRQGITKHLRVLEDAGIVVSNRAGRETLFSFVPDSVQPVQSFLELVSNQWEDALERLRVFVEKE